MNGNSKYSNVLTMILVVLIVAILGVIVYFAYDLLNSNKINSDAQNAMDEFQKATTAIRVDNSTTNTTDVEEDNTSSYDRSEALRQMQDIANQQQSEQDARVAETKKVYMEGYEVIGTINIPKTKCEYPILERVTKKSLEIAVARVENVGPEDLNQVGNVVIYGHNYRNGLFFSNNKNLKNGDLIYITDRLGQKVTYEIYNIYQTTANDADFFRRDTEGRREISLQTCTDDGASRIIVWAKEKI